MTTYAEPTEATEQELASYAIASAQADALRMDAEADAEAKRIRAQGEADAARTKAVEEARKQSIANDKAELAARRQRAEQEAKIAKAEQEREAIERETRQRREADRAEQASEQKSAEATKAADKRWRLTAMGNYALCAAVALPVQIAAFWDKERPWMALAPVLIEALALVVLIGASAAVTAGRAHWHYRLIAWGCAFVAAGINLAHGLDAFDEATAIGTALASIAGPGVWDLHEHGRIAKKLGRPTWRQQRAEAKAAKNAAAEKAAEEAKAAAQAAAAAKLAEEKATALAGLRQQQYPEVWTHALRLAAALGETTVTEAIWRQAHIDIEGAEPGEDAATLQVRNNAARRVLAARSTAPGERPIKVTSPQLVPQIPRGSNKGSGRGSKTGPKVRGVRRPGDTAPYSKAARKAAAETAREAAAK
ncbi:hypothetical protein [Streptomyces sp. XC 2026]|uniref:hypothetical protein n=1 Tax=Streptomyces sp. XC 2026 TaxID=2782004 RepID=UPI001903040C|nr:hypothetical protein [Streptomyces sp. XC 2026]QQN79736.1 hypothetical protein IPZ77_21660 [Streptomyces sp. XC 2026]QQN80656.1 hypothetical protein IPZ77_26995 [Streptomyces sp. XC 2026]